MKKTPKFKFRITFRQNWYKHIITVTSTCTDDAIEKAIKNINKKKLVPYSFSKMNVCGIENKGEIK